MKNVILGMIAKISKMDAEAKQLAARVEAQSLLLAALLLTVGKNGGVIDMVDNVKKAINAALDSDDNMLRSDAEMLLNQFNELLTLTQLLESGDADNHYQPLTTTPSAISKD
ncbi:anti-adapter protein IraP [Enterobacter sp.]|uniref:anti-adapter protein IraP n=1 Tax=Enterobacter sp. TaxID=42895 RepID=UPI00296F2F03|nr:anti-adapter protein IraP [Enterobacter sp.]